MNTEDGYITYLKHMWVIALEFAEKRITKPTINSTEACIRRHALTYNLAGTVFKKLALSKTQFNTLTQGRYE